MVLEQQFTCFSQQKVPVCRQHRRGIPPSSITRHVSRQHAETLTPIQRTHLLAQVADRWPLLEPSAIQNPGSTCRALPTLTIDGFRCAVDGCLRGNDSISRSRQVMLRYRNRVHGQHHRSKTTGVDSAQEPKFVRWFVVRTSTVPETTTQDWQRPEADLDERLFKESLDEDVASFKTLAAPESHVKETPRLRRTGFHHYLQDCDKAELTLTVSCLPSLDERCQRCS